jgi:hypothetical protein
VFKFGGCLDLSHLDVSVFLVMYFYTTRCGQCVIQVWGMEKHSVHLFVCLVIFSCRFIIKKIKNKNKK